MSSWQVIEVLGALRRASVTAWVDGGWGVDALLGEQTREHDDLDLVVPADTMPVIRSLLAAAGFAVDRDWLPTARAMRHHDGRAIDLHPVEPTADGGGDGPAGAEHHPQEQHGVSATTPRPRCPGDGIDPYLATPERVASWVAEVAGHVVGLTGLFDHGTSGEIEPVVVAASHRGRGIGQKLVAQVVDEARHRGYDYVAVRPVARNVAAIRHFHAAGFVNLGGHLDLTLDLARRRHTWRPGVRLHERDFGY